jgi:hypothetical protein
MHSSRSAKTCSANHLPGWAPRSILHQAVLQAATRIAKIRQLRILRCSSTPAFNTAGRAKFRQRDTTAYEASYHFGVGARRAVSARNDLGVRLELDEVADRSLVSFRALDYRFRVNRKLALGAFLGVGRYDLTLDAHGYYFGAGVQYRDLLPGWDVGLDYRRYDKLDRDKGLASDPESNPGLPRRYIDLDGVSLYMSKRW